MLQILTLIAFYALGALLIVINDGYGGGNCGPACNNGYNGYGYGGDGVGTMIFTILITLLV